MKIEGTEIAPSGKRRLKIYLGDQELEIMSGLVSQALKYTPSTAETLLTLGTLRSMNSTFVSFKESDKAEEGLPKVSEEVGACIKIWFDGGTPCNVPSRGFGEGYGSFRITETGVIEKKKYGQAMSANAAEIRTIAEAIKKAEFYYGKSVWLHVIGDSQIALKWVKNASLKIPIKASKGSSPVFMESINMLYEVIDGFPKVITEWNPREKIFKIFGH